MESSRYPFPLVLAALQKPPFLDRKSTRLNSSHYSISYAVFCLKKKIFGFATRTRCNRDPANLPGPLFRPRPVFALFFFNDPAPTEIYTLSLHDPLPISDSKEQPATAGADKCVRNALSRPAYSIRSEEHTSELQSLIDLVCRLLLEK